MEIVVNNLVKEFNGIIVLNNINLKFKSGNIYGLYGRNGSGKSVFMKILSGFYNPTNGEVLYDGVNLNSLNEFPESLGVMIEKPSFFPDLTGYENLKLLAQINNKIGDKEILKTLDLVNLMEFKDKKYSKYSLGMKQKLGLAQAIMEDQKIILLDEIFNGIDNESVNKIIEYFLKEKDKGKIIVISSHIKEDLNKLCDKIFCFDNGKIIDEKHKTGGRKR